MKSTGTITWFFGKRCPLLTEKEVSKSWRTLFKGSELHDDDFSKAEALLEELRAESPLRHRLSTELEELRKIATASR